MRRNRRASAAQKVADRGKVSVGVRSSHGLGALDEAPKHLPLALNHQVGRFDDEAAAISRVGAPPSVASPLQAVDHRRDPAGGEAEGVGELGGRQGTGLAEQLKATHISAVQAKALRGYTVETVDLGAQTAQLGLDSLNQRTHRRYLS